MDTEKQAGIRVTGDSRLTTLTAQQLRAQGFAVLNGDHENAHSVLPDVMVFAVAALDDAAVAEVSRLRKSVSEPLVVVGGKGTSRFTTRALQNGADECLIRPYSAEELAARLRAVLRRTSLKGVNNHHIVRTGGIVIDFERLLVTRAGSPVHLSRTEWRLLSELARNVGRIVPASQLLARVWGPQYETENQYLRVRIWKLRRLLEDNPAEPRLLKTVPRVGYRLELID
jgi:two-component system, OmpR family, KDP operon response regulator KdpE